jgi:transposase InsO family protein
LRATLTDLRSATGAGGRLLHSRKPAARQLRHSENRAQKLFASAPQTLSQAGRPRAFLHDQPTEDVFVLLQGLTNAPEQFDKLGRILFERGHNVVLPLTPGHGEADLMTDKLEAFTAQAMLDSANEAVTLAHGLGRRVTEFWSVEDARAKLEKWRVDYNVHRPHSSLANLPPAAFANELRQRKPTTNRELLTVGNSS